MGDLGKKGWRDLAGYTSPTSETQQSFNPDHYNDNNSGYQTSDNHNSWSPKSDQQDWDWNNENKT